MHSGKYDKLRDAVSFYNDGRGNSVPKDQDLLLHWHITSPNLTEQEVDLIVEFLGALTDESLVPATPEQVPSGLTPIGTIFQQADVNNNNKPQLLNRGGDDEIN